MASFTIYGKLDQFKHAQTFFPIKCCVHVNAQHGIILSSLHVKRWFKFSDYSRFTSDLEKVHMLLLYLECSRVTKGKSSGWRFVTKELVDEVFCITSATCKRGKNRKYICFLSSFQVDMEKGTKTCGICQILSSYLLCVSTYFCVLVCQEIKLVTEA